MPENSYIFNPTFNNSTFNIVRFDINLLHLKTRERKGLKISNFTLLLFVFTSHCGSERVQQQQQQQQKRSPAGQPATQWGEECRRQKRWRREADDGLPRSSRTWRYPGTAATSSYWLHFRNIPHIPVREICCSKLAPERPQSWG